MLFKHLLCMRVHLCKIHCPHFTCFCNSSPQINTSGPLISELVVSNHSSNGKNTIKVEDANSDEKQTIGVQEGNLVKNQTIEVKEGNLDENHTIEVKEGNLHENHTTELKEGNLVENQTIERKEGNSHENQQGEEKIVKSSLKKTLSEIADSKYVGKKKVQWMDNLGKELIEIKVFESSEEESDIEGDYKCCSCFIL